MKPKEQTDSMRNRRSSVIVRMMLVFAPCLVACAEVEADGSRKFLIYPLAQPSPGLTFNNTQAQVRAAAGDAQLQLLATVGHARVSAPEQMAEVLEKLRLESAAHLGRLDQEERTEMMAAMHGAGRWGGAGRPEHIAPAHGGVAAECSYRSVGNRIASLATGATGRARGVEDEPTAQEASGRSRWHGAADRRTNKRRHQQRQCVLHSLKPEPT